jgi:hypothetical protein
MNDISDEAPIRKLVPKVLALLKKAGKDSTEKM